MNGRINGSVPVEPYARAHVPVQPEIPFRSFRDLEERAVSPVDTTSSATEASRRHPSETEGSVERTLMDTAPRPGRCRHERSQFVRVVIADGRTQIMERCLDCGANARGLGRWVPRAELALPLEALPLLTDLRKRDRCQPTLFGGGES
jgi:hypothetical protein